MINEINFVDIWLLDDGARFITRSMFVENCGTILQQSLLFCSSWAQSIHTLCLVKLRYSKVQFYAIRAADSPRIHKIILFCELEFSIETGKFMRWRGRVQPILLHKVIFKWPLMRTATSSNFTFERYEVLALKYRNFPFIKVFEMNFPFDYVCKPNTIFYSFYGFRS